MTTDTPPTYEKRVVAFIDILGFTNYVKTKSNSATGFAAIYDALKELEEYFKSIGIHHDASSKEFFRDDTQVITVSDCIVISRRIDERGGIYQMLWDCDFATHLLIKRGFLCRGGIAVGDLYHKDNTIFGPAYLNAYNLERTAINPVIKFYQELFDVAAAYPFPGNEEYGADEAQDIKEYCKPVEDEPNAYYLDYFTNYDSRYGGGEGTASIHYEELRKTLVAGLSENKARDSKEKIKVFDKYAWAARRYNLTAHNFELALVEIPPPIEQ
ncbi:hypothetical protein [Hymenobacter crusticola]|uniref:Guanylate cyclase domain-containing protein n=1 Tax=Hymenobacter crusticola TaxID=1770526 RepID=A0A243W6K4_9BACT|nr:hypothetical protein [Hymenobacter crusticola]OUJ69892.1 hypothetical protein BXP70_25855 [Hymenobacter crusticola]